LQQDFFSYYPIMCPLCPGPRACPSGLLVALFWVVLQHDFASAFDIVVRAPPASVVRTILHRFPPPESEVYRRKEYLLQVGNVTGLPGNRNPCAPNTFMTAPDLPPLYVREVHHFATGRPWLLGREMFEWTVREGGLPTDATVLEYGCGALSVGIWLIEYLQPGHYFGLESVEWLLDAGRQYEVPLHMLQSKRPTLSITTDGEVDFAGVGAARFDRILAPTAFHHLKDMPPIVARILRALETRLLPHGTIAVMGELPLPEPDLRTLGLRVHATGQWHCRWLDCDPLWFELTADS